MAKVAACFVVVNSNGEIVRCVKGKKMQEKAKTETSRLTGYKTTEINSHRCPICNPPPKAKTEDQEQEQEQKPVIHIDEVETMRPGQCLQCRGSRAGLFRLSLINRCMVRTCQDCGHKLDITTLETWED